ncbi:hypothetical protein [Intrasporangium sp. YIM S08009]|uniref:hypothetical protein n=1 Tax=Intrasporangium zincisolvens TaxID=3080018 RepID=UPI002B05E721|nr:hypothetical protein [Intrasporangium sp. YIM S08009]
MSQMTATARPLRAPRRAPAPAPLRVIPSSIARTGNGAFAAICITLLVGGLIALLLLNTALAQGSLALGDLQRESARLDDTASNLHEQIDAASATGALARSASELGMVRMNTRGYIDLRTGKVTGKPEAATKQNAFPIVTSPTPPTVTKKVSSVLAKATKVATAEEAAAAAAKATGATPTTPGATDSAPSGSTLGTTQPQTQQSQQTQGTAPTTTR